MTARLSQDSTLYTGIMMLTAGGSACVSVTPCALCTSIGSDIVAGVLDDGSKCALYVSDSFAELPTQIARVTFGKNR